MMKMIDMNFGDALEALKQGEMVARHGWNGKGQFVYFLKGAELQNTLKHGYGEYLGEPTIRDMFMLKTAQNDLVSWVPSISDCLAEDWEVVYR